MEQLDITSKPVQDLIHEMVEHHVALTSTLPVFEPLNRAPVNQRVLDAMSLEARQDYLDQRARFDKAPASPAIKDRMMTGIHKEMQFERTFVQAGGLLLAGSDPGSGNPGVLQGFGLQREIELLVEAGFTPVEAMHIATANGAQFLGESAIGIIAPGKQADIVVIRGDPTAHISDIEKIEIVFKDGLGYEPAKLLESVRGKVGLE
jgi:hypothetical protein